MVASTSGRRRTAPRRGRRSQEQAAQTRARIEEAALQAFAEAGFGSASTREIAKRAKVNQQLITHHFKTKLALWKAVADRIFAELGDALATELRASERVDGPARARLLMRKFVRFSVDHPEVARFMIQEGARRGPRLQWLVQRHVRPLFETIRSQIADAQARGLGRAGDPLHLAYIVVGATALLSQAGEFELLTGRDPRSPEVVEAHTDLLLELFRPGTGREKTRRKST